MCTCINRLREQKREAKSQQNSKKATKYLKFCLLLHFKNQHTDLISLIFIDLFLFLFLNNKRTCG